MALALSVHTSGISGALLFDFKEAWLRINKSLFKIEDFNTSLCFFPE